MSVAAADPWPWPADTELERARRVARQYREALEHAAPALVRRLDALCAGYGQGWVAAAPLAHHPDELLTTAEVAELCQVRARTVTKWRLELDPPLPAIRTPDGVRIRVGDLLAWQAARRHARLARRNGDRRPLDTSA